MHAYKQISNRLGKHERESMDKITLAYCMTCRPSSCIPVKGFGLVSGSVRSACVCVCAWGVGVVPKLLVHALFHQPGPEVSE